MHVPNAEGAFVAEEKVRDYLLSSEHLVGRFKARFFTSLGYKRENLDLLVRDLKSHLANEVASSNVNAFGRKYEVRGELHGPTGRTANMISVWIVLSDEDYSRLITAYPES